MTAISRIDQWLSDCKKLLQVALPQFGIDVVPPFTKAFFPCLDNDESTGFDTRHLLSQHGEFRRVDLIVVEEDQEQFRLDLFEIGRRIVVTRSLEAS